MMKISLNEIKTIFNELISETKSREQISSWASERQRSDDEDNLEFEPFNEEKKIWRGILYLIGVDLKDMDGDYLHSIENFIDFRNQIMGSSSMDGEAK